MNGKKEVERGQETGTFIDMLRVSRHMLVSVPGCTVWSLRHNQTPLWKLEKEADVWRGKEWDGQSTFCHIVLSESVSFLGGLQTSSSPTSWILAAASISSLGVIQLLGWQIAEPYPRALRAPANYFPLWVVIKAILSISHAFHIPWSIWDNLLQAFRFQFLWTVRDHLNEFCVFTRPSDACFTKWLFQEIQTKSRFLRFALSFFFF